MHNHKRRLERLEETIAPSDTLQNGALVELLSCGLLPLAVALVEQGQHETLREIISEICPELSSAQVNWAVQRLETRLPEFSADAARGVALPAEHDAMIARSWRNDAELLARNRRLCGWPEGPQTDPDAIYAETVAYWRDQGVTIGCNQERAAERLEQTLRATAALLAQQRGARGTATNTEAIYAELRGVYEQQVWAA